MLLPDSLKYLKKKLSGKVQTSREVLLQYRPEFILRVWV